MAADELDIPSLQEPRSSDSPDLEKDFAASVGPLTMRSWAREMLTRGVGAGDSHKHILGY